MTGTVCRLERCADLIGTAGGLERCADLTGTAGGLERCGSLIGTAGGMERCTGFGELEGMTDLNVHRRYGIDWGFGRWRKWLSPRPFDVRRLETRTEYLADVYLPMVFVPSLSATVKILMPRVRWHARREEK